MNIIKPTPLHSILARHRERRTSEGQPVHKYFTKKQWDLLGTANLGDGSYAEKQGWVRVVGDKVELPPEAKEPFKSEPKVMQKDVATESNAEDPLIKIKEGLANTLTIKELHKVLKDNSDVISEWLEGKGKSTTGLNRLPKRELAKLLTKYFKA